MTTPAAISKVTLLFSIQLRNCGNDVVAYLRVGDLINRYAFEVDSQLLFHIKLKRPSRMVVYLCNWNGYSPVAILIRCGIEMFGWLSYSKNVIGAEERPPVNRHIIVGSVSCRFETIDRDTEVTRGSPWTSQDPHSFVVHRGICIKDAIIGTGGADSGACHVLGVICKDGISSSRGIVGAIVIQWIVRLSQEVGPEIVQCETILVVAEQTNHVVSFQTGNPPSVARRGLIWEQGVLVDVDLSFRETVVLEKLDQRGVGDMWILITEMVSGGCSSRLTVRCLPGDRRIDLEWCHSRQLDRAIWSTKCCWLLAHLPALGH